MNSRLTFTSGIGWYVESQADDVSPWIAVSDPCIDICEALAAAGIGQTVHFTITGD